MMKVELELSDLEERSWRGLGGEWWLREYLLRCAKQRQGAVSALDAWADDCIVVEPIGRVSSKDAMRSFEHWYLLAEGRPLPAWSCSAKRMAQFLQRRFGALRRKSGTQGFDGIGLAEPPILFPD